MSVIYEWDLETYDRDANDQEAEILDHSFGEKLSDVGFPSAHDERLVLVRTVDGGDRQWAYVDNSRMLPKYFSIPQSDGKYYETATKVPQQFHRDIAKFACGS